MSSTCKAKWPRNLIPVSMATILPLCNQPSLKHLEAPSKSPHKTVSCVYDSSFLYFWCLLILYNFHKGFLSSALIEAMAFPIKLGFFFFVLVYAFLLLPHLVHSDDDDENNLLQGINSYRKTLNLPALVKNGNADCLADQIADDIEDQPCSSPTNGANIVPSTQTQLSDLSKHFKKCKIDANTTTDGIILPVCVPKLVPTLVLTNYTRSHQFAKYVNDSRFTGIGVGSEDDWTVVVLATSTPAGSFANAAGSVVSMVGLGHYLVSLLLGLSLVLVN